MTAVIIGLLWHSDRSGNLGVGALTVGNIALVRSVAAELGIVVRFVILGFNDVGRPYIDDSDVQFEPFATGKALHFAQAIGRCDAILDIGAGDSFADIYPTKRFAWIVLSKIAAIQQQVPLVLSPQTIGPFIGRTAAKRLLGRLAFWAMRRARAIVVRDDRSRDAILGFGLGVQPVYSVDVAFALPWTPVSPMKGRARIGLNISGLLWRGGYTGRDEFELGYDYKSLMTCVIETLIDRGDCVVELICHVNGYADSPDNDGTIADELAARFPTLIRVADFASPSKAKTYISGLDVLIAARMHACIAAFSSGVAVVPVSYSRKFEGLFGSFGYTRVVTHTGMTTQEALAMILSAIDERAAVKNEVAVGLRQVAARLDAYRAVLRDLLHAIT